MAIHHEARCGRPGSEARLAPRVQLGLSTDARPTVREWPWPWGRVTDPVPDWYATWGVGGLLVRVTAGGLWALGPGGMARGEVDCQGLWVPLAGLRRIQIGPGAPLVHGGAR